MRSFPVERVTVNNIKPIVDQMVGKRAHLMTDSSSVLIGAGKRHKHSQVNHPAGEYSRRENGVTITTNSVEGYFAS